MAISLAPLTPHFGAKLTGVDIARPLTDAQFGEISAAFDEFSVLVLPEQPLTDEQQIIFSERFGILEGTRALNPGSGTPFARQSNLDIRTGETIPADDRRMFYQKRTCSGIRTARSKLYRRFVRFCRPVKFHLPVVRRNSRRRVCSTILYRKKKKQNLPRSRSNMILSIHVERLVSLYRTMKPLNFPLPAMISFVRIRTMDATR